MCDDVGLPADRLDVELGALSGGQQARAALAAVLLSRFDVLLLDEPTNDLDGAGLDRLERFVARSDASLVIVSHDRTFLERTIERVVELDEHTHRSREYGGGWSAYLEARATARRHAERDYGEYQDRRRQLGDRSRAQRQWAVTGVKALKNRPRDQDKAQKGFKVDRTEKQAGKVRITEKALERLEVVDKPWEGWQLDLSIAVAPRSGAVTARLHDAVVEVGTFRLGPLSVEIGWADRVSVLGPNGSGKTTLLRALLGQIPLTSGERWLGPGVVVGELDQGRRRFLGARSVLDAFVDASGLLAGDSRSLLAKFALAGQHVARPAGSLSPGERTRVALALLMARGVNCLVLDEPTNHLDLPAIEQLESALDVYDGTLILVTHDRQFLDAVRIDTRIELG